MKKLPVLLFGFLLGLAAMYVYSNYYVQGEPEAVAMVKPKGVITPAEAIILNDNWSKKPKVLLDSLAGRPDNRSAWWSIEDIQNYINYAENQTGGLGYEMDGLRMYFGVYPSNARGGKADYSTIFIVPTGKKIKAYGTILPVHLLQSGDDDIPGGNPLNDGAGKIPPGNGYGG